MSQQFSSTMDTQQKEGRYIDPRLYPCMDSCSTIPGIPGPLANITGYSLQSLSSTWHCNKWKGGAGNLFLPYKLFEELCINWSCQGLYFLCYICIERFDFNTLLLKLSWFFFSGHERLPPQQLYFDITVGLRVKSGTCPSFSCFKQHCLLMRVRVANKCINMHL